MTTYESDFASRPHRVKEMVAGQHHLTMEMEYDAVGRVSETRELIGPEKEERATAFTYDSADRVTEIGFGVGEHGVNIRYDALNRVAWRRVWDGSDGHMVNYAYVAGGHGVGSGTAIVREMVQEGESFAYEYDALGNIVKASRNGVETSYVYDALSQLVRVSDPSEGKTTTFTYDRGGNILERCEYAYTTGALPGAPNKSVAYLYEDTNWKDKLTSYDGKAITYDEIGNPLTDGTWAYTWKHGRQLAKMRKGAAEPILYTYNRDGLRIQKQSEEGVTKYLLAGSQILRMTREKEDVRETELYFRYYETGKPVMCRYNGTWYGYKYNAQGDVVALYDLANGRSQVVTYGYDAWGKVVRCEGALAGTLGKENPFRYRGYVYDEETGLYYLRSRYYNPAWGRFVNADALLGNVGGLFSHNTFTFCTNNPVNMTDNSGCESVPCGEVESLTWEEFTQRLVDHGPVNAGIYKGTGTVMDLDSGISFEVEIVRRIKSEYHFDLFLADPGPTVKAFQEVLGITSNEDVQRTWSKAGAWNPRAAVFALHDEAGTQTACSINLFPHSSPSGEPSRLNLSDGHICMYFKDTVRGDPARVAEHQAKAVEAANKTRVKPAAVSRGNQRYMQLIMAN